MADRNHIFWDVVAGRTPPSPSGHLLGWKVLEAEPDSGTIKLQFDAKPEFRNPVGDVQTGILAAMLDYTASQAIATTFDEGEFAPTLEIKVSFIQPAKVGAIFAEGTVIHRGRSVAFVEAELRDANGDLLARASTTARIVKMPPARFQTR